MHQCIQESTSPTKADGSLRQTEDALEREQRALAFSLEQKVECNACLPPLLMDMPQSTHESAVMNHVMETLMDDFEQAGANRSTRNQIWRAARQLGNIRKMTELLSRTEGDLFRVDQDEWGYCVRTYRRLADRLRLMLSTTDRRTAQIFPYCELEPHVEVFFESFLELLETPVVNQYANYAHAQDDVVKLNRGVQRVRERVRSEEFSRKIDHLRSSIQKNSRSMRDYIDALFAACRKLLIIRIDLSYKNAGKIGNRDVAREEVMQAIKDRDLFFKKLKRQPFAEHFLSGAWKLEYGLYRGPHIHALLVFDGTEVRKDGLLAKMCGDFWVELTEGRGDYFNCNANKGRYRRTTLGIGMVTRGDAEKRARLQVAAGYLVEIDYVRRVVFDGAYRTFGKGGVPPARRARAGRPRGNGRPARNETACEFAEQMI